MIVAPLVPAWVTDMLSQASLAAAMLADSLLAASFARAQDDLLKQLGLETPEKNSADGPLAPAVLARKGRLVPADNVAPSSRDSTCE
jgi:hypothetical protein